MRNFGIVLKYTFLENVKKKSFIVSTIIISLLTILLFNIPNISNAFSSKESDNNNNSNNNSLAKIILVDKNNEFDKYLNNFHIPNTNYIFASDNTSSLDDLKKKVSNDEIASIVVMGEKGGVPTFQYIVKNPDSALNVADTVSAIIKSTYSNIVLEKYNVDQTTLTKLNTPITYEMVKTNGDEINISLYFMSIFASLILYFAVYFYGYSVSTSISTEKTSRVMETLITSTKPSTIVVGKTIAMGLLGLAQLLFIILIAALSKALFVPGPFTILGTEIDFSVITLPLLCIIIVYFILGYFLYAMLNAVTGSTVSKAEDLSSAAMPVTFVSLLSFYLGYFSLTNPTSAVSTFASIFPFSAAFTMPCRMFTVAIPMWQIITSVLVLIATIILLAILSVRIYSFAVLYYGQKLKLKDLFKLSKDN